MKRVAADSLWGRKLTSAKGSRVTTPDSELPPAQVVHNQYLDNLRAINLAERKARRLAKGGR